MSLLEALGAGRGLESVLQGMAAPSTARPVSSALSIPTPAERRRSAPPPSAPALERRLRAVFDARATSTCRQRTRSAANTVFAPEAQLTPAAFERLVLDAVPADVAARVLSANVFAAVRKFGARRIGFATFVSGLKLAARVVDMDDAAMLIAFAAVDDASVLTIALGERRPSPPPPPRVAAEASDPVELLGGELAAQLRHIFVQFCCYGRSASQSSQRMDPYRYRKLCVDCTLALPSAEDGVRRTSGGVCATTFSGITAARSAARTTLLDHTRGGENDALALVNRIDRADDAARLAAPASAPRRLPQVDLDLLFTRCKAAGERSLSFAEFVAVLRLFSDRFGDGVERIAIAIVASGPPSFVGGTRAESVRFHDDFSTYTGTARVGGPETDDTAKFRKSMGGSVHSPGGFGNEAAVRRAQRRRLELRVKRRDAAAAASRPARDAHLYGAAEVERWRDGRAALADSGVDALRAIFLAICIGERGHHTAAGGRQRISSGAFLHKFAVNYGFLGSGPYREPELRALFDRIDSTETGVILLFDYDAFRAPGGLYDAIVPGRRRRFDKLAAHFEAMRAMQGGAPAVQKRRVAFPFFRDELLALTVVDCDLLFKKVVHDAKLRHVGAQARARALDVFDAAKDTGAPQKTLAFDDFLTACVGILELKGLSPDEFVDHLVEEEGCNPRWLKARATKLSRTRAAVGVAPPWAPANLHPSLSGLLVHAKEISMRDLAPALVAPYTL